MLLHLSYGLPVDIRTIVEIEKFKKSPKTSLFIQQVNCYFRFVIYRIVNRIYLVLSAIDL